MTALFPSNAALEALPDGFLSSLLQPDAIEHLRTSVLYHVFPGAYTTHDFSRRVLRPLAGGDSVVYVDDTAPSGMHYFNGDKYITSLGTGIEACNGIIHTLNAPLNQPMV